MSLLYAGLLLLFIFSGPLCNFIGPNEPYPIRLNVNHFGIQTELYCAFIDWYECGFVDASLPPILLFRALLKLIRGWFTIFLVAVPIGD